MRPLVALLGWLAFARLPGAATSRADVRAELDTTSMLRSLLQVDLRPVSYANFSQPALLNSMKDLVDFQAAQYKETLQLTPLHSDDLRAQTTGAKLFVPAFVPEEPNQPLTDAYLAPSDVEQIEAALGPNISALGISPADPTIAIVTTKSQINIQGLSRADAQGILAMPTLFSPQHMNFKLQVSDQSIVAMQAVTLWLPEVRGPITDSTSARDLPMFQLDAGSRVCFLNSTIVVYDCDQNDGLQVICWTATGVAAFQAQYVTDLGNWDLTNTYEIDCISTKPRSGPSDSSDDTVKRIATIGVPLAVLLCLLCVAAGCCYRHRVYGRKKDKQIAEMTSWKSKYLDLLQTNVSENSVDKPVLHDKMRAPPMMLEAIDGAQDPKGLQQQLQMVLSGTDDAPISVMGELGRGAFGVVYKGVWKNMEVAIKTVLFQASADLKNDPVIREACIALRVAHEHLVATYHANVRHLDATGAPLAGVPTLNGNVGQACQLFLVQEFCDAGTLYQWLANSRLHPCNVPDKAVIVRCALDISLGIQALHASSIVHGDLKPQNVLLTSVVRTAAGTKDSKPAPPAWPYAAKLTDFGLSFRLDDQKSHLSNLHVGTPFYLAPEVQGSGYLSKAADLYSLGVLLWELYHGMPPYASSEGRLVNNQCFPRFNLRSRQDAPFSYAVLTLACLSKEHSERPTIDEAVAILADLNNSLNGTKPSASAYMRMTSLSRYTRGQSLQTPPSMLAAGVIPPPHAAQPSHAAADASDDDAAQDIAGLLMTMMQRTGLQLDKSLFKRLCNSNATELQRLAGHDTTGILQSGNAANAVDPMYIHGGAPELFDLLPPASVVRNAAAAPGVSRPAPASH